MDLLRNIKSDRARQRTKQAYERNLFNTVGYIVKVYGLGKDFLKRLDSLNDYPTRKTVAVLKVKAKKPLEIPPYCLVSQEEYGLVLAIVGKVDNPYLISARSPEEMLLAASLYQANPSLKSRDLLRHDFETLLFCEEAKKELSVLERRSGGIRETESAGKGLENNHGAGSHLSTIQERIKQLQTFVTKVEHTEFQTE